MMAIVTIGSTINALNGQSHEYRVGNIILGIVKVQLFFFLY
jgi:hypothetical protein